MNLKRKHMGFVIANFEEFRWNISLSPNLLFLTSDEHSMVELLPFCCSKLRMFKDFLKNSSEDRNLLCKRTTTPSVKSDLKTFQSQVRCGISNAIHEICHIIGIQLPSYFIVYVQVYTFQTIIAMELVLTEKNQISVFHNYKILYKAASTTMSKRSNSTQALERDKNENNIFGTVVKVFSYQARIIQLLGKYLPTLLVSLG